MIIDCISDLHGHFPKLEGGDLLIIAGDLTEKDTLDEHLEFIKWCAWQSYKKIVYISGNHDNKGLREPVNNKKITYLCDSGTEVTYYPFLDPPNLDNIGVVYKRKTLKIWGSPWTLRFEGMNPHCMAFTVDTEEELAEKWAMIPDDVDILVTHSPPQQVRDWVNDYSEGVIRACGSESLKNTYRRIKPKLHVFGHIHEGYGQDGNSSTIFVNASHVNERYEPVNKPIRVEL